METKLHKNIKSAISNYAQALASQDASLADLYENAVRAYCAIVSYDELKEANSLFNEIFVNNALAKGVSEEVAKNRAKSSTSALRARAKKYGWIQPSNPKTVERPKGDIAPISVTKVTEIKDGEEVIASSQSKIILTGDYIRKMVGVVLDNIPRVVYTALFTKEGKLRPSLLKTSSAVVVSDETARLVESEINRVLTELNSPKDGE